jgi:hypothetical protein
VKTCGGGGGGGGGGKLLQLPERQCNVFLKARNTVCVFKVSYCAQSAQAVTTPSVHIWRHFSADRGCLSQDRNAGLSS